MNQQYNLGNDMLCPDLLINHVWKYLFHYRTERSVKRRENVSTMYRKNNVADILKNNEPTEGLTKLTGTNRLRICLLKTQEKSGCNLSRVPPTRRQYFSRHQR